jgi:hypothetical protein
MQIRSNFPILHQNVVVNQSFVLSNIEEFGLHDRWIWVIWVASIALSNALHFSDKVIRGQMAANDNFLLLRNVRTRSLT